MMAVWKLSFKRCLEPRAGPDHDPQKYPVIWRNFKLLNQIAHKPANRPHCQVAKRIRYNTLQLTHFWGNSGFEIVCIVPKCCLIPVVTDNIYPIFS
jgi:hypothetical protein